MSPRVRVRATLSFVVVFLIIDLILSHLSVYRYQADHEAQGTLFWTETASYHTFRHDRRIPRQLPGPLDLWGGGVSKSMIIDLPRSGRLSIAFDIVDRHDSAPPTLRFDADGTPIATVPLSSGAGATSADWETQGASTAITIELPSPLDARQLTVTSTGGSWVAFDGASIRVVRPWWEYAVTLLGGVLLMALGGRPSGKPVPWQKRQEVLPPLFAGALLLGLAGEIDYFVNRAMERYDDQESRIDALVADALRRAPAGAEAHLLHDTGQLDQKRFFTQYAVAPLPLHTTDTISDIPADCGAPLVFDYGTLCFTRKEERP